MVSAVILGRQTSEKPDGLLQLSGNNIALQLVNQSFNSALSEDVSVRLDPEVPLVIASILY